MRRNDNSVMLGYDFDSWYGYGKKEPLFADISLKANSHILLSGMSGSGKSYALVRIFRVLSSASSPQSQFFFADFKQDDSFEFMRGCPNYYPYMRSIEALENVYDILHKRQSGEDMERYFITLFWDEYMANILALQGEDKKKATDVMNKVSEILMLGRSLGIRLICSCQRPDAKAFPDGSRLNYGIILALGAPMRSIYEMLMPREYIDRIEDRQFGIGEGVLLLQGSELHFIKIPVVRNIENMHEICVRALL